MGDRINGQFFKKDNRVCVDERITDKISVFVVEGVEIAVTLNSEPRWEATYHLLEGAHEAKGKSGMYL